jgi:decaprenyl-phosphate phosphoribosyltransferase
MAILKLMRVHHWTKNLLVFIPIFFAGGILQPNLLILTLGFISFCLAASSIYIFNDYMDRDADRMDASKKNRPLVNGTVSVKNAIIIASLLVVTASVILLWLPPLFSIILGGYILLNILYSIWLKHVPIVDVVIISIGFLLRIFGGGILGDVALSKWIIVLTFFIALLISFAKRRSELLAPDPIKVRPALKGYNLKFTDLIIVLLSSVSLIFYVMYTIDTEVTERLNSSYIFLTVIFVLFGFLRYLQQVFVNEDAGSPVDLLIKDHWLKVIIILWLMSFYYFLYV